MNKYWAFTMHWVLVTWPMHVCTHTHRAVYLFPKSTLNLRRIGLNMRVCVCVCVCAPSLSHVWLFVTPRTVACQAPLDWARILEWVVISYSRWSSQPRDQTCISCVPCIGRWVLYLMSHQQSPSIDEAPLNKILHYKIYNPVKVDTS